jgi:hypothetical protein
MAYSDRGSMWISLIASGGVLIGLILVAIELNQNTQQLRLQLEFQSDQKIVDNNRDLLGDNPTPIIAKSITDPKELTFEEALVASSYFLNLLNEFETRYFIYQAGLIEEQDWKRHIDENICWTLGSQFAQTTWHTTKSSFEPEFVEYVDDALAGITVDATYGWWLDAQDSGEWKMIGCAQ